VALQIDLKTLVCLGRVMLASAQEGQRFSNAGRCNISSARAMIACAAPGWRGSRSSGRGRRALYLIGGCAGVGSAGLKQREERTYTLMQSPMALAALTERLQGAEGQCR
jgi:hypothetical protein